MMSTWLCPVKIYIVTGFARNMIEQEVPGIISSQKEQLAVIHIQECPNKNLRTELKVKGSHGLQKRQSALEE